MNGIFYQAFVFALLASLWGGCGDDKESQTESSGQHEILADTVAEDSLIQRGSLADLDTGQVETAAPEQLEEKVETPKPKLRAIAKVAQRSFDFGFIDEGEKIKHTFTLKNTGKANLKVHDVETACGCTVAEVSPKNIAPNKTAKIEVVFDSHDKFGKQAKTITLHTNAGSVKLVMNGVVYPKGFREKKTQEQISRSDSSK